MSKIPLIIIAGPTASGKSQLAVELARHLNGEIVNGDSMQVYGHLVILTAQPKETDLKAVPHHLYGVLKQDEIGSVAWWCSEASARIKAIHQAGKIPIVVGGTGLYLNALLYGLSEIPSIPDDIRQMVRLKQQQMSKEDFYQEVISQDSKLVGALHPSDRQRLMRALEVMLVTGKSIKDWQHQSIKHLDLNPFVIGINIPRALLYQRINQRVLTMIEEGALKEVEALSLRNLPVDHPIRKALGVPEFAAYLKGTLSLEEAIALVQQASRNYAKRQMTWFRNQMVSAITLEEWPTEEGFIELLKTFKNFLNQSI